VVRNPLRGVSRKRECWLEPDEDFRSDRSQFFSQMAVFGTPGAETKRSGHCAG
jgi:hypothetical protein